MDVLSTLQDQVAKYRLLGSRIKDDLSQLGSLTRKLVGADSDRTDQLEVALNTALSRWNLAWDQLQYIAREVSAGVDVNRGWSLAGQAANVALEMEGITAMVAATEQQMATLAGRHGVGIRVGETSKLVYLVGYGLLAYALYGVSRSRGARRY